MPVVSEKRQRNPPGLAQIGASSDYAASVRLGSDPQKTQHAGTAGEEDRITPATKKATGEGQKQPVDVLYGREILLLIYNFIREHNDADWRKVLNAWQRKVSVSKTERNKCLPY